MKTQVPPDWQLPNEFQNRLLDKSTVPVDPISRSIAKSDSGSHRVSFSYINIPQPVSIAEKLTKKAQEYRDARMRDRQRNKRQSTAKHYQDKME